MASCPGYRYVQLVNTTHQWRPFCGKLVPNPGQDYDKIVKYYICPSYKVTGVGNRIETGVEEFKEWIIYRIFPIRVVVWNIEKNKVTELKDFEEGSIYISLTKRYMVQKWK